MKTLQANFLVIVSLLLIFCLPEEGIGQTVFGEEQIITPSVIDVYDLNTADLDGDGDMDVLSASNEDNKIAWYANDGEGIFEQHIIATDADFAKVIEVADLDNDGDLDVIAVSDKIVWYENDGLGNFSEAQIIVTNVYALKTIFAVDLDGDGDQDILRASSSYISWYENDGLGNFDEVNSVASGIDAVNAVFAIDLDNDGDKDVLMASGEYNLDNNYIVWYENDGLGVFGEAQSIDNPSYPTTFVKAADFDNDGDGDVIYAKSGLIIVARNDGLAGFTILTIANQASGITEVFLADIDNDGDIDVSAALAGQDKVVWYVNNGDVSFTEENIIDTGTGGARAITMSDIDSNGNMDLLSTLHEGNQIVWYANDGFGNFGSRNFITSTLMEAWSIYTSDFNGDGYEDILSASVRENKLVWYVNNGAGKFIEQNIISTDVDKVFGVYAIDIDGDEDMDVLSASGSDDKIAWYANNGLGEFGEQQVITTNANGARSVFAADLDGDDDMDVLSASIVDDKIAWYGNDGFGNFGEQQVISTNADGARCVFAIDLDNDNDIDVLYASSVDDKIAWYANDGTGVYGEEQLISLEADGAKLVYAADLDGDGDIDVLSASEYDNKIAWYTNDGLGNFSDQNIITVSAENARYVYAIDLDRDGDVDVLSASDMDDKIAWYQNYGFGNFSDQNIISANASGAVAVYAADLDNDGDNDVLSASRDDDKIAWYENLLRTNKVNVQCFSDLNQNEILDEEDYWLSNQNLTINPWEAYLYTSNEGLVSYYVDPDTYEINYQVPENWQVTTPTIQTVNIESQDSTVSVYFGIYPSTLSVNANINLTSAPTRCNQEVSFWLHYTNTGTQALDGLIELNIDELPDYISASLVPDSIQNKSFYWQVESLLPFQTQSIELLLQMPNANAIGEQLNFDATIYELDETVNDYRVLNVDYWTSTLLCSYDPNDKLVHPTGIWDNNYTLFDDTLDYTIRFQNTGNDTAFHVRITDQLSSRLDWETFNLVASSHSVETSLDVNGLLAFNFPNILLPDSTTNEVESHGFVRYRILAKQGFGNYLTVNNTANIYFDLNPPIVTNTTLNTMVIELPVAPIVSIAEQYFCSGSTYVLLEADIGNGIEPEWMTLGDGSFENQFEPSTTYHLGETDLTQDTLQLVVRATSPIGSGGYAYDTLQIIKGQGPNGCDCSNSTIDINALNYNIQLLNNSPIVFNISGYQTATVAIWGGTSPYNLEWQTEGYVRQIITEQLVDTDEDGIPDTPGALVTLLYADNASWELVSINQNHCIGELFNINSNVFEPGSTINIVNNNITPDTGGNSGSIELTLANNVIGCLPYNYELYNVDSLLVASGTTSNILTINNLASGWYTCYVYCDSTDINSPSTIG